MAADMARCRTLMSSWWILVPISQTEQKTHAQSPRILTPNTELLLVFWNHFWNHTPWYNRHAPRTYTILCLKASEMVRRKKGITRMRQYPYFLGAYFILGNASRYPYPPTSLMTGWKSNCYTIIYKGHQSNLLPVPTTELKSLINIQLYHPLELHSISLSLSWSFNESKNVKGLGIFCPESASYQERSI